MNKKIQIILLILFTSPVFGQVQVNKFTGDATYGLPLITVPNFRGPSVSTSLIYRSDIKMDQSASEVGLGWDINAGGSIERTVNGVPDDWDGEVTSDLITGNFQRHYGSLNTPSSSSFGDVLDVDYTRHRMDNLDDNIRFNYLNYDSYVVVGSGMTGQISPESHSYGQLSELEDTYRMDAFSKPFESKHHFQYNHNHYSEVDSRYYPWDESPISSSNTFYLPGDLLGGSAQPFSGAGYNDDSHPDVFNRTKTSNYITYYTNSELIGGVAGFLDYPGLDRSGFPAEGIGAYQIVDPNGYTYHYSLPVYEHYTITGNFVLGHNNEVIRTDLGVFDTLTNANAIGSYLVKNNLTEQITESKQNVKYAIRWLLTAITGPDFKDSGITSDLVDLDDKGYWVKYDYGLWSETSEDRFPDYGSSYAFSKSIEEEGVSAFRANKDDLLGNSGKLLNYTATASQDYYLNQIQTPSHTGVFVRGYRYDEQEMETTVNTPLSRDGKTTYFEVVNSYGLTNQSTLTDHVGAGSVRSNHPNGNDFSHTLTISPDGYNSIYNEIYLTCIVPAPLNTSTVFSIDIYDGNVSPGTLILHRDQSDGIQLIDVPLATSGTVTIVFDVTLPLESTSGFDGLQSTILWDTGFDTDPEVLPLIEINKKPRLKLSQLLLFDNSDLGSLPSKVAAPSNSSDVFWDYSNLNLGSVYTENWYTTNKSTIDNLALQSVELEQDYTLAKGYLNNKFVSVDIDYVTANQIEVEAAKEVDVSNYDNSGKLTLNKVIYYGLNKAQTQPAHLFDYDAVGSDNPDYNTLKQDYWGNYKSDATGNLYKGYPNANSASGIDAWSLRKITSPLGGITEIVYEADQYEQVLSESETGGLRGPIKMFKIEDATPYGEECDGAGDCLLNFWAIEFENGIADFGDEAVESEVVIPGVYSNEQEDGSYSYYSTSFPKTSASINSGDGTLVSKLVVIGYEGEFEINKFVSAVENLNSYPASVTPMESIFGDFGLLYSGNGYIAQKYAVGEKVYGGGTRVKALNVSTDSDSYTVAYTYEEGTATVEASNYSVGKSKEDEYWETGLIKWSLTSFEMSPFGLAPQVGYGQVTVVNKGKVDAGQGKSVFKYNVSNEGKDYLKPYNAEWEQIEGTPVGCPNSGPCSFVHETFATEIRDDFSSIWGKVKEQDLFDVNNLMISKKKYDYASSTKGGKVSTLSTVIEKIGDCCLRRIYNTNIFRKYPNYLDKITTYSNGKISESYILDRDPFTGAPIRTRNVSANGTENIEETVMAYTQDDENNEADYRGLGPKTVNSSSANFLNATYSSKSSSAPVGVDTDDFSSYGKSFWKTEAPTLFYAPGSNAYFTGTSTVNWYDYAQYSWIGPLGTYGLYDNGELTGKDIIEEPGYFEMEWRLGSEITLMDTEQNVLEQKGFNDRFNASKLGYDNRFTYTRASNSSYASFTSTGFEDLKEVEPGVHCFEGEVFMGSNNQREKSALGVTPHTGNYFVTVPSGSTKGPSYFASCDIARATFLQRGRTYTGSVWVHQNSVSSSGLKIDLVGELNGSRLTRSVSMLKNDADAIQIGEWIQLNVSIAVPKGFICRTSADGLKVSLIKGSSNTAYFDDLQFKSTVTGSGMQVYDQKTGRVMAVLNDNNFATKYKYNDAGQVIEVWREVLGDSWGKWVKVETKEYNFKRSME